MRKFLKTKIICTLGPSTFEKKSIKELVSEEVDVLRFNFSHGNHTQFKKILNDIREVNENISLMADLKGTEIRTFVKKDSGIPLKEGEKINLVFDNKDVNQNNFSLHYSNIKDISKKGMELLIDDGKVNFKILDVKKDHLVLKTISDGILFDKKSTHFIDADVPFPLLTEQDKKDIKFALDNDFDFIAASMIKSEREIYAIRGLLDESINLVSKIEHPEAVKNIEKIIDASDQILVARGDLGVKMPITKVPIIQKNIVKKARERGKPVIIATQLLESMVENPRPTRAEVNDIASAIFSYVDALMLTGETAAGKYPIEAVRVLKEVIKNTENSIDYSEYLNKARVDKGNISESISSAAVDAAYSLPAKAILCFTASGSTALRVAKFRPKVPVFAFTHNKIVARQLNSVFGIIPFTIGFFQNIDKMFEEAEEILKENSFIKNNDRVIITAGTPIGKTGTTNIIKIVEI